MKWVRVSLQTRAVIVFVGLLAVGPLLWARHQPLPPERVAALRLLAVPTPPVAGRDASDALWLVNYDVPIADRARAAAQVRAYYQATRDMLDAGHRRAAERLVYPLDRYPRFPDHQKARGFCKSHKPCLAFVRRDPAGTATALRLYSRPLEAARELAQFEGFRYGLVYHPDQAWPTFGARPVLVTAFAARFASGETVAAIADTCTDLAAWRRIGSDADLRAAGALSAAWVMQDLGLLSEMLAEQPVQASLPPECITALAATTPAELDVCPTVRFEFRSFPAQVRASNKTMYATSKGFWKRMGMRMWDPEFNVGIYAPKFASYCGAGLRTHVAADRPAADFSHPPARCTENDRIGHQAGCASGVSTVLTPHFERFDDWLDRRSDQAAALALMRTWLWLRTQSSDPVQWPRLLPKRPASLGLRREVRIDDGGARLSIPRFNTGFEKRFDLRVRSAPALPPPSPSPRKPRKPS
ncbi:MAG: hypothetical protein ACREO3_01860 [Arenimonas sp.]